LWHRGGCRRSVRADRLIIAVAALATTLATARLGWWQLDRAAQKNAIQSQIESRRALPALRDADIARYPVAELTHRAVSLQGRWIPSATVFLDNRQMQGRPGFYVLTPLRLSDGSAVLVQRGWVARDPIDRTRVAAPALPAGDVEIVGRFAPPPSRLLEFEASASGAIRQNLDLVQFRQELRLPMPELSVLQTEPRTGDGLQRDWPEPASGVHKHYGYAFQWFALATLTVVLYVWFQLIRPRRLARHPR
jgi:surfeit locus 1 family protein